MMSEREEMESIALEAAVFAGENCNEGCRFSYARVLITQKLRKKMGLKFAYHAATTMLNELGYDEGW